MKISTLLLLNLLLFNFLYAQKDTKTYSLAMENFNAGNYSIAIDHFQKCITEDNVDNNLLSSAKIYICESLLGLEQSDGAIAHYENFLKEFLNSNFRELAYYRLGNLYFDKKLYDKSRDNLISLVNQYPLSQYSGSSYHLIGETFIEENDLDKAENFFSSAVNSKKNNSLVDHSIYSLANLYEKKGKYEDAVKYYDKLLGYHEKSDLANQAQLRIGICYFHLKEYDNAVLELSDPSIDNLETKQKNEADYILANSFYRLKEYDNASDAYKRILNNSPNFEMLDKIRYGLAWIHFQKGSYSEAFKLFKILSTSKNDSVAIKSFYWSGEAKRYDGKFGESIDIHKAFAEKYPNHRLSERVKLNIGISKFSEKSFSDSEESLLVSSKSSDPVTKAKSLTLLGEINLRKKDYKASEEYFKRGLLIPQMPLELNDRCNLGLGVSYFFVKNNISAIEAFNKINLKNTKVDKTKLSFYKAEAHFFLGNYSQAVKNYNQVQTDDITLLKNSVYGKAYSYFNIKDFSKAAHFFNEYIKTFGNDDKLEECQLRLADCYYGTKSFGKASLFYEKVLINSSKFRTDERSFFNYAQSLFKRGNAKRAIQILNDIQTKFPTSEYADNSQYLIGWINFQQGEYEKAITSYRELFSEYPQSQLLPVAYYSIGDSYFNLGNYKSAISTYNKLITQYPNTSYVYDAVNGIQYCYIVQDRQNEAINYLKDFQKKTNSNINDKIQFKIGEIYYSSGEYQSALSEYKILTDNYPNSGLIYSAYFWMGKSANLVSKNKDAVDYFRVVINNAVNTEVGFNSVLELGKIFRNIKDYESEINLYNETLPKISNAQRASEIKFAKAQSYIENDNIPLAYQALNEIVSMRDGSLFYHKAEIELAILEIARSSYVSSLDLLKDVSKNRSDDIAAQAQYLIGLNYFEQDKLPEAITELIKVRSLYSAFDEWYTKSLMLLGDSYVKIDNKAKAVEMYKAILKRHRRDNFAKEAKEKLNQL